MLSLWLLKQSSPLTFLVRTYHDFFLILSSSFIPINMSAYFILFILWTPCFFIEFLKIFNKTKANVAFLERFYGFCYFHSRNPINDQSTVKQQSCYHTSYTQDNKRNKKKYFQRIHAVYSFELKQKLKSKSLRSNFCYFENEIHHHSIFKIENGNLTYSHHFLHILTQKMQDNLQFFVENVLLTNLQCFNGFGYDRQLIYDHNLSYHEQGVLMLDCSKSFGKVDNFSMVKLSPNLCIHYTSLFLIQLEFFVLCAYGWQGVKFFSSVQLHQNELYRPSFSPLVHLDWFFKQSNVFLKFSFFHVTRSSFPMGIDILLRSINQIRILIVLRWKYFVQV